MTHASSTDHALLLEVLRHHRMPSMKGTRGARATDGLAGSGRPSHKCSYSLRAGNAVLALWGKGKQDASPTP